MKKLLLGLLIFLLTIICVYSFFNGINLFNIPSIYKINNESGKLEKKTNEAKEISDVQYENAINALNNSKQNLENAKKDYEDIIALASTDEYSSLGELQQYYREYIWIKLGVYAKENDVSAEFEFIPVSSTASNSLYDIQFTILGNYIDVIDYIYAIEGDEELKYLVEDLNMIPVEVTIEKDKTSNSDEDENKKETSEKGTATMVQATFKTRGVTILD